MDEVIELALVKESVDAKDHPRHVAQATETVGKSEVGSAHSLA
jgi:hypothetical protein